jgi:hypothetical protein
MPAYSAEQATIPLRVERIKEQANWDYTTANNAVFTDLCNPVR